MISRDEEAFLLHYGVKGMRWGVRKDRETSGNRSSRQKPKAKNVSHSEKTKKHFSNLSDSDLSARLDSDFHQPQDRKGLTRNQKVAIAGGAVVVAGLASYGAYRYIQAKGTNPPSGLLDQLSSVVAPSGYQIPTAKTPSSLIKLSTKERLARLSTSSTTIPAGTVFQRMTTNPEESLSGFLYAAHSEFDKQVYGGEFVYSINARMPGKEVFKSLMEFDDDIRLPSQRERVTTYLEAMTALSGRKLSKKETHDVLSGYSSFMSRFALGGAGTEEFVSRLKAKGYNAVTDDHDAGLISQSPVILFDVAKSVKRRTAKAHDYSDVIKSIDFVKDISRKNDNDLSEILGDLLEV